MGRGASVFVASDKLGSRLLIFFFGFGQAQVGQNYLQAIGQGEIYRNLLKYRFFACLFVLFGFWASGGLGQNKFCFR